MKRAILALTIIACGGRVTNATIEDAASSDAEAVEDVTKAQICPRCSPHGSCPREGQRCNELDPVLCVSQDEYLACMCDADASSWPCRWMRESCATRWRDDACVTTGTRTACVCR